MRPILFNTEMVRAIQDGCKPADLPLYGWEANPWVFVISFERITKDEAMQQMP